MYCEEWNESDTASSLGFYLCILQNQQSRPHGVFLAEKPGLAPRMRTRCQPAHSRKPVQRSFMAEHIVPCILLARTCTNHTHKQKQRERDTHTHTNIYIYTSYLSLSLSRSVSLDAGIVNSVLLSLSSTSEAGVARRHCESICHGAAHAVCSLASNLLIPMLPNTILLKC